MTCDLYNRVTEQQGYEPHEYEVLTESEDIGFASDMERQLQKEYGYKVDRVPYNKLKCNKNMKINVTEQTTTFPYPINKLKGHLVDNLGNRSYIYNKAFARYFDNNNAHETRVGGLFPTGVRQQKYCDDSCSKVNQFDLIRDWAKERGLYDKGDPKTQALKLVEEVGETCRAILKEDKIEAIDGIGDCVVVLTNLAELLGTPIEVCINTAYNEIKDRKGKMNNGTYVKND